MDRNIESILDTGGRQLSPTDRQFVTTLYKELEQFQYQAPKDRALMFHPLGGYQRYLIHKVTEIFPKLTSFSIGDETDRRTVVCFKSKRKEQQLQQARALAGSPESANSRGRGAYPPAGGRSRESSRGRNKSVDRASKNKGKKPDQQAYLPRPLRAKKNANSLPRSRSLHTSPNREGVREPYYTDDDGRKKKKRNTDPKSNKPLSRSTSMHDTRKSRSRPSSRPTSPPDTHRKSKTLPKSGTQSSLEKRGHGLKLEGKVVNGDVEDPYGPHSDIEEQRMDSEAVKRHRQRPSSRTSTKKGRQSQRDNSPYSDLEIENHTKADIILHKQDRDFSDYSPPRKSDSEHSDSREVKPKRSSSTLRRKKDKTPSKSRDSSTKRKSKKSEDRLTDSPYYSDNQKPSRPKPNGYVDEYLPNAKEEGDYLSLDDDVPFEEYERGRKKSLDNDQVPPPYVSTSPAARNLDRIKRSDSTRSSTSSSRSKSATKEEVENKVPVEVATPQKKEKRASKKSKNKVDQLSESKKAESDYAPEVEKPKLERRKSAGNIKSKSPSKKKKSKEEKKKKVAESVVPVEQPVVHSSPNQSSNLKQPLSEENLLASNGTLYMPLPNSTVEASTTPTENYYVNRPQSLQSPSNDATPAPLLKNAPNTASTITTPSRCDSEVQTERTGTLSRSKSNKSKSIPENSSQTSSLPDADVIVKKPNAPTTTDPAKFVEDFCKMMLNFQDLAMGNKKEKDEPKKQMPDPKMINPFAAFYPGNQVDPQQPTPPHRLYSQFPPHISYQLYMSWMAAYYAGATGSWPPPPPFAAYNTPDPKSTPHYDYHGIPGGYQPGYASSREGYSSSSHPSPQKEPYSSNPYENNSMMYNPASDFQPSYTNGQRKTTGSYGSDAYEYPRSQSPFEHLASVSMSSNHGDNKSMEADKESRTESRRGRSSTKDKNGSNSTLASGKMNNNDDALPTQNDGADTDASSFTSSSTKPEIAVQSGPKGGVMVYVRSSSQSNSRANSTVSGEDVVSSGDHLNTPINGIGGLSSPRSQDGDAEDTPDDAEQKSKILNKKAEKKSSRRSSKSSVASSGEIFVGSSVTSSSQKSANIATNISQPSDISHNNNFQQSGASDSNVTSSVIPTIVMHKSDSSNEPRFSENSSTDEQQDTKPAIHTDDRTPAIVLLSSPEHEINVSPLSPPPEYNTITPQNSETQNEPQGDQIKLFPVPESRSFSSSDEKASASSNEYNVLPPDVVPDPNVSHEEVFLSLSRAPLATMDEESELSRSAASSFSSIDVRTGSNKDSDSRMRKLSDTSVKHEKKTNGYPNEADKPVNQENSEKVLNGGLSEDNEVDSSSFDYYNYTPNAEMYSSEPYNRIAEIYDFQPNFKDVNIVPHFNTYNGFKLWWVDDTHALGVFGSPDDLEDAIARNDFSGMKIRPISQASTKSKKKAKLRVEDFGESASTTSRPKTDTSVAKRMISHALGGKHSSKKKDSTDTGSLKQSKKKKHQERRKSNIS